MPSSYFWTSLWPYLMSSFQTNNPVLEEKNNILSKENLKHVLTGARAFTQLSASSCKVFLVSKAAIALFCWFAKLKACRLTQTPTSAKIHLMIPDANWMPSSYQQTSPWPFFLWALVLSFGHPVQLIQHQWWHSLGTPFDTTQALKWISLKIFEVSLATLDA